MSPQLTVWRSSPARARAYDDNAMLQLPHPVAASPRTGHNSYRVNSPISKRRRHSPRAVSFADEALVYPSALSLDDEVSAVWYSRLELDVFKNDRRRMVQILKQCDFDVGRVGARFCLRGLEPYFSIDANIAAKGTRDCAMRAVFVEQASQRRQGRHEPEALRSAALRATEWSRRKALEVASRDAAEARAIHEAFLLEQIETELASRADKGLTLGRRGVAKTPSLTQQEATSLARALQKRQD